MKAISFLLAGALFIASCGDDQSDPVGNDNHTGGGAGAPQSESTVDSLGSGLTPGTNSAGTGSAGSSDSASGGAGGNAASENNPVDSAR